MQASWPYARGFPPRVVDPPLWWVLAIAMAISWVVAFWIGAYVVAGFSVFGNAARPQHLPPTGPRWSERAPESHRRDGIQLAQDQVSERSPDDGKDEAD
jgi:hypothetical protein